MLLLQMQHGVLEVRVPKTGATRQKVKEIDVQ